MKLKSGSLFFLVFTTCKIRKVISTSLRQPSSQTNKASNHQKFCPLFRTKTCFLQKRRWKSQNQTKNPPKTIKPHTLPTKLPRAHFPRVGSPAADSWSPPITVVSAQRGGLGDVASRRRSTVGSASPFFSWRGGQVRRRVRVAGGVGKKKKTW